MSAARKRNRTRELNAAINDCVEQFGVPEPGVFLAHIMAGVDPRKHSSLLAFLRNISRLYKDAPPPLDVWTRVRDMVESLPPFDFVDVDMSTTAARALMPFLYAKKKDIEISGSLTHGDLPPINVTSETVAELAQTIAERIK